MDETRVTRSVGPPDPDPSRLPDLVPLFFDHLAVASEFRLGPPDSDTATGADTRPGQSIGPRLLATAPRLYGQNASSLSEARSFPGRLSDTSGATDGRRRKAIIRAWEHWSITRWLEEDCFDELLGKNEVWSWHEYRAPKGELTNGYRS
jgi:hypothetical protein